MDTVDPERLPHNEWVINVAVGLGRVLCELDPEAAAARDAALRSADAPPPLEFPSLSGGLIHAGAEGAPDPLAGSLAVQGLIATRRPRGATRRPPGWGLRADLAGGRPARVAGAIGPSRCSRRSTAKLASLGSGTPGGSARPRRPAHGLARGALRSGRSGSSRLLRLRQRREPRPSSARCSTICATNWACGPAGKPPTREQDRCPTRPQ